MVYMFNVYTYLAGGMKRIYAVLDLEKKGEGRS